MLIIIIITDRLIVATESVKESLERLKTTCFICGYRLAADPSQHHNHIGQHVLKCMRKIVEDPKLINEVSEYCSFVCYLINTRLKIGVYPCGTCGKSTAFGNCSITIATTRGMSKVTSTCPEFTTIKYATALSGSVTTPCTNVPVACELCMWANNSKSTPAVWRYNLEVHVRGVCPGHTHASQFSDKFLELCTITSKEQIGMGIPREQIPPVIFTPLALCSASTSQITNACSQIPKHKALVALPSPQKPKLACYSE